MLNKLMLRRASDDLLDEKVQNLMQAARSHKAAPPAKIPTSVLNKLKTDLAPVWKQYWPTALPKPLMDAFTKNNVVLLDDDLTAFEGFLTGAQGRASFMLGLAPAQPDGTYAPSTTFFHLQWHKMPTGKYELNGYFG